MKSHQILTSLTILVLFLLEIGCSPPGPVRNTPVAKLNGQFLHNARRADALGLTPASTFSTQPTKTGDILRALSGDIPNKSYQSDLEDLTSDEQ